MSAFDDADEEEFISPPSVVAPQSLTIDSSSSQQASEPVPPTPTSTSDFPPLAVEADSGSLPSPTTPATPVGAWGQDGSTIKNALAKGPSKGTVANVKKMGPVRASSTSAPTPASGEKTTTAAAAVTPKGPVKKSRVFVVDTGALIKGFRINHLLLADGDLLANKLVTVPDVLAEVKDAKTRALLDQLPIPLLTREPSAEAMNAVQASAKTTGDHVALSLTDKRVLALAWMEEKEAHGLKFLNDPVNPQPKTFNPRSNNKSSKFGGNKKKASNGSSNKPNGTATNQRKAPPPPSATTPQASAGSSQPWPDPAAPAPQPVQSSSAGDEHSGAADASAATATKKKRKTHNPSKRQRLEQKFNAATYWSLPIPALSDDEDTSDRSAPPTKPSSSSSSSSSSSVANTPAAASGSISQPTSSSSSSAVDDPHEQAAHALIHIVASFGTPPVLASPSPSEAPAPTINTADLGQHVTPEVRAQIKSPSPHQPGFGSIRRYLDSQPGLFLVDATSHPIQVTLTASALALIKTELLIPQPVENTKSGAPSSKKASLAPSPISKLAQGRGPVTPSSTPAQVPASTSSQVTPAVPVGASPSTAIDQPHFAPKTRFLAPSTANMISSAAPDDEGDEQGWITPDNVVAVAADPTGRTLGFDTPGSKRPKGPRELAAAKAAEARAAEEQRGITVAMLTTDYAMQNVALVAGINLYTLDGLQIRHVRQYVLKCEACFKVTRIMEKKFCPSCGNSTLYKVTFHVNSDGSIRTNDRNRQPRLRGTKYSIPAPKGGKFNRDLILREDQLGSRSVLMVPPKNKRLEFDESLPSRPQAAAGPAAYKQAPVIGMGRKNPNETKPRNGRSRRKKS